jgi:hypothetical protein
MSEVNFSTAPEGSTHYYSKGTSKWFKATPYGVQYFENGQWNDAGHYGIGVVAGKAVAIDPECIAPTIAAYFSPISH